MASFKMTGTLVFIGQTVQVSDKFAKREFVINDVHQNLQIEVEIKFQML